MQLRLLIADDAEAFRKIRLEAMRESPAAFTADYEINSQRPLSHFAAQIKSNSDNFVVGAFDDDELVAIGGFFRSDGPKLRHKGNVWSMYVTPRRRGAGLGRKILQEIIAHARNLNDIEQVLLSVVATNTPARELYLAFGFKSCGREPRSIKVDEQYYDEEHMVYMIEKK